VSFAHCHFGSDNGERRALNEGNLMAIAMKCTNPVRKMENCAKKWTISARKIGNSVIKGLIQ
jgi:hypothetical protein